MAERLGVSARTVSRWLSGRTQRIRARHLVALAHLLAIDRHFLIAPERGNAGHWRDLARAAIETNNLTELLTPTGHLDTAEAIIRALLDEASSAHQRAALAVQLALACFRQGKYGASRAAANEALEISSAIGAANLELRATTLIGHHHFAAGDLEACIATYEACLQAAREMHDVLNVAANISNLGDVLRDYGDFARADQFLHEAIDRYRRLERPLNESIAWGQRCGYEFEVGTVAGCARAVDGLGHAAHAANHTIGKHQHSLYSIEYAVMSGRVDTKLAARLAHRSAAGPASMAATTALHVARILRRADQREAAVRELELAEALAVTQPVLRAHIAAEWACVAPDGPWPERAIERFRHIGARLRVA